MCTRCSRKVCGQKEPGFSAADDVKVAVAVHVGHDNLHPASHPAAVVDDVADPLDSTIAWARFVGLGDRHVAVLIPVDSDRFTRSWVRSIVGEVTLSSDKVQLAVAVEVCEGGGMGLGRGVVDDVLKIHLLLPAFSNQQRP